MNILFFIASLNGGGAEKVMINIASYLPSKISRQLITIYDSVPAYDYHGELISLTSFSQSKLLRILKIPVAFIKYLFLLNDKDTSVCLSVLPLANFFAVIGNFFIKKPVLIAVHNMPSKNDSPFLKYFEMLTFRIAVHTNTRIIAVSNGVKDELIQLCHIPDSKIEVIYNPLLISEIQQESTIPYDDSRILPTVPLIITVGRLSEVKGQWHLIRAFSELRKTHPSQLLICGIGNEKEYLFELVTELNLKDDVIFLGWQKNPYKYIANSTVFVLPSLSEALPNVLIEAMACGCPVVSTNCSPGIGEILGLDNTCGLISEKMSGIRYNAHTPLDEGERALYKNILNILENPELRREMSIACKERAKQFDVEIGIKKYIELIDDISVL